GVPHLRGTDRLLQDEGGVATVHVARDFRGDAFVAAHQVRAHGLVVLERAQPVRAVAGGFGGLFRQLLVPVRVGDLVGQLARDLALAVFGEARARDRPGFRVAVARDHTDTDAL